MTDTAIRVVLVDDDQSFRKIMSRELERSGFLVSVFESAAGVREHVLRGAPEVVLLDLRMPGKSGGELLRELLGDDPQLQVIVLTGHGAVPEAVEAMRVGAFDFLTKPVGLDVLEQALRKAAAISRLIAENRRLRRVQAHSQPLAELRSSESLRLERQVARIAPTDQNVLVLGESGVGKELVARRLHEESPRAAGPFVPVNCGAIPRDLIESELFGHARGAFTGAAQARTGLFDAANGGTLFLDEIGELPLALQPALLRVLQLGEVRAVGSDTSHLVDVRIVAATNRDLREAVADGNFREDLFYRLAVLELQVAPLRARQEDIVTLARFFLQREASRSQRPMRLSETAEQWLVEQAWPGNVRELENTIVRAAVLATGSEIDVGQLMPLRHGSESREDQRSGLPTLRIRDLEMLAIEEALRRCSGNKTRAAEELGIALKTLYNKLAKAD